MAQPTNRVSIPIMLGMGSFQMEKRVTQKTIKRKKAGIQGHPVTRMVSGYRILWRISPRILKEALMPNVKPMYERSCLKVGSHNIEIASAP